MAAAIRLRGCARKASSMILLRHWPRPTRDCILLAAVVSLAMAAVGFVSATDASLLVAAVGLAWLSMIAAIIAIFTLRAPCSSGRAGVESTAETEAPHWDPSRLGIRQRIHDGPSQLLAYIILRLDDLEEELAEVDASAPKASQIINETKSASVEALNELKQISRMLPA